MFRWHFFHESISKERVVVELPPLLWYFPERNEGGTRAGRFRPDPEIDRSCFSCGRVMGEAGIEPASPSGERILCKFGDMVGVTGCQRPVRLVLAIHALFLSGELCAQGICAEASLSVMKPK